MHRLLRAAALAAACFALPAAHAQPSPVTALHTFAMDEGFSGASTLLLAADGSLYGTMEWGGDGVFGGDGNGDGTLFRVAPDDSVEVVHVFSKPEGSWPTGSIVQTPDGRIWGTTQLGGSANTGVLYTFDPATRTTTKVHDFTGPDGEFPASLTLGSDGVIYGVTNFGGASDHGTVFRVDPATAALTTIHSFAGGRDGWFPSGGVVLASDGALWGSTQRGGVGAGNKGLLYRLTRAGDYRIVHRFDHVGRDGCTVLGDLMQAANGLVYGTTNACGSYPDGGVGTVFSLSLAGDFQVVHTFDYHVCGASAAGLTQAADGTLFGSAGRAGHGDRGCVWQIAPDGTWSVVRRFHPIDPASRPSTGVTIRGNALYMNSATTVFDLASFK